MANLNIGKQNSLCREQHRGPAKKLVFCMKYSFAVLSVYIASLRNKIINKISKTENYFVLWNAYLSGNI